MAKARWYGRRTVERTRMELRASSPADQGATDRCSRTPAMAALATARLVDANDANDAEDAKKNMVYAVAVAGSRACVRVRRLEASAAWRTRGSDGDRRPSAVIHTPSQQLEVKMIVLKDGNLQSPARLTVASAPAIRSRQSGCCQGRRD